MSTSTLFQRTCQCLLPLCLTVPVFLIPTKAHAQPDCDPRSIVAHTVGGELLNQVIGGFNQIAGAAAGVENFIKPTPSSLMSNCILPEINPPTRDDPPFDASPIQSAPPRTPSLGWGDPHLVTHDGMGYDFQGAGDYVYVEGGGVTIQARQFRLSPEAIPSRIKAFAIRVDDTTVVINDPIDPSLLNTAAGVDDVITVNGVDLPIGLGGWIDLDSNGSFIQRLNRFTYLKFVGKLDLLVRHGGNTFKLALNESLRGNVSGLLGDFDGNPANDLRTAAGRIFTIDDTSTLYGEYLTDWLRQGEASMFNTEFEPSADGAFSVTEVPLVSSATLSSREALAQSCIEAGVRQEFLLHGCIYDLLFDGDDQLTEGLVELVGAPGDVIAATAFIPSTATTTALGINATVSPSQPSAEAGRISNINEIDHYTVDLPAGTQRVLQWIAPCSSAQPFSILLESDDGKVANFDVSCDAPISLPDGQSSLSIYSQGGDTGDYFFNLIEPASTDLGIIALNEPMLGTLTNTERLIATLPATTDNVIFIASNQTAASETSDCRREWRVLDAAGVVIKRNSVCNDLGLVTLGENTPFQIVVLQGSASAYNFTVFSSDDSSTVVPDTNREFELVIDTPGQSASVVFPVTEGQRIYVNREGGVASGRLTVTNPQSVEIGTTSAFTEDIQFEALNSGNYTLTLQSDGFTGTVPIQLLLIADDTQININRGQTFTLTLTTLGQRASANFEALEGETFTVFVRGTNTVSGLISTPNIQPPGSDITLAIFDSRTFTAETSGTYQVVLYSSEIDNSIGSVDFELQ